MPIIVTSPKHDAPIVRAIMRDLMKYGYCFEYLQNYEVCKHFTTYELRTMWQEEKSKLERL